MYSEIERNSSKTAYFLTSVNVYTILYINQGNNYNSFDESIYLQLAFESHCSHGYA